MESTLISVSKRLGIALALSVVLIYGVSLAAPLMFDDLPNLVENPLMQFERGSFDAWRAATVSGESGALLRPVSMFSFAVNFGLEGEFSPASLKAANLLIHLFCAVLVYRLAMLLFAAMGREREAASQLALLAASCWVLHPLHVSTVLYSIQRMAQLSTLFVLLGLVVYSHYRLNWLRKTPGAGEVVAMLLWSALITCIAMLSKENGVLLPWLALVLEVSVFRGRLGGRSYPSLGGVAVALLVLPVVGTALVYALNPEALASGYFSRDFSLQERVLTQLRVLWNYVSWFFWPDIRSMGFHHDDIVLSTGWLQPVSTLIAGVAWLLVLATAVFLGRRLPVLLLGALFFLVGHALESTVLPLEIAFEHRNYLPTVGLALIVACLLEGLCSRLAYLRPRVIITPVLFILALLLAVRAYTWSDVTRLARADALNHPQSVRAQFLYADALYSQVGVGEADTGISDGALLFAAREQFIKVNELAGGHATALVMLYFADTAYLAELEERPDWLVPLSVTLVSGGELTSSDHSAIESLTGCAVDGVCQADRAQILQLLNSLLQRFPGSYRLLQQRYRLTASMGLEAERIASLSQLQAIAPRIPALYSYSLTESASMGSKAGVYTAMAGWMAHDRVRKYLPMLRLVAEREASSSAIRIESEPLPGELRQ